jgi:hypothetical protein
MVAAFVAAPPAEPVERAAPDVTVVERRVEWPFLREAVAGSGAVRAGAVVPLDGGALLRLDGPLAPVPGAPVPTWRATGRVHTGWPRPLARVEVELVAWSEHAVDVVVRPAAGRPGRWGPRRRERYFALVHHAADRLAEVLLAEPRPDGAWR